MHLDVSRWLSTVNYTVLFTSYFCNWLQTILILLGLGQVRLDRANCPCPEQGRNPNSQLSSAISASTPWPSGLKRWNQMLVLVVRARFEPRCGRPHFAPTSSGVRVCGRNRTEVREREWAEGTVFSLHTGHIKHSDKILP